MYLGDDFYIPMRVLFVDDDDVTLFLYKVLVKSFPECTAFFARDGKEALNYIESEEVVMDMMFLDINMPVMDGFELLQSHEKLTDSRKVKNLYVMLGTDISDSKKEKLFNFANVRACLPKPLRLEIFTELVQKIRG